MIITTINNNNNNDNNDARSQEHEQPLEKMPPTIHWAMLVKLHWTSNSPLGNTTDKLNSVGTCH